MNRMGLRSGQQKGRSDRPFLSYILLLDLLNANLAP